MWSALAPALLLVAFMALVLTVNRHQDRLLEQGRRVAASRLVVGSPDGVVAHIADLASQQRGRDVKIDPLGTVTWRDGVSLWCWGHRFRAEVRPAGMGEDGEALSEVRVGFRLRYGLYDWGIGDRLVRTLLADLAPGCPPARPVGFP